MSSILILSDDFIFSAALGQLLVEVNPDFSNVISQDAEKEICHVMFESNINRSLLVNKFNALIVDINEDLNVQTMSMLNRIRRDHPLLRVMVFVNEIFDYQSPLTRILMDLCDILVNRYESISGLKRNLTQLGLMTQRRSALVLPRFSGLKNLGMSCSDSMFSRLSKREIEIINYLAQGKSPSEIAKELYVSTKTVYTHRLRIYAKLGVKNIIELHKLMRITSII